ncbi:hypothetical protein [Streptomyces coelicoflavus]|uniref:hypothetical protein n=1 Tax=Streptomyces coelicoflavus TaxID=285562 RepID=UPI003F4A4A75
MISSDSRLVKVAVLGSRTSDQPIILPAVHDDALRLKRRYGSDAFWCGSLLGGCGGILTARVCHGRVSHFAHRPGDQCRRRRTDEDSADHLYLHQEVRRWLDKCGLDHRLELRRQTKEDWTYLDAFLPSPGLRLRFYCPYVGGRLPRSSIEIAASGAYDDVVLGEHTPVPSDMYAGRGYLFRLRMVDDRRENLWRRRVQIGSDIPGRGVEWRYLDECWITKAGLMTPVAADPAPPGRVVEPYRQPDPPRTAPQATTTRDTQRRGRSAGPTTPFQEAVFIIRDYLQHCAAHRETTTWDDLAEISGLNLRTFDKSRSLILLSSVDAATPAKEPLLSVLIRGSNGRPLPYLGDVTRSLGRRIPQSYSLADWCEEQSRLLFVLHKKARAQHSDASLDSARRSADRIDSLLAKAKKQLEYAGAKEHLELARAMKNARAWQNQWRLAGRRGVAHRTWWAQRESGQDNPVIALERAVQRFSGALLESVGRELVRAACRGETVTVADLFGPQGRVAPKLPAAGLVRTLVRAEGTVTDDVPILSTLITTDSGDPPPEARAILAGLGFVRPVSDEVLGIVWRQEHQRAWAAHATPPRDMPPRRIPRLGQHRP